MPNKQSIKGEVVEKYINENPDEFNRTLARKMYQENIDLFSSIDDARTMIRYYKGALGDSSRAHRKIKKNGKYQDIYDLMQEYKLRTEAERIKDFVFDKATKKIGVLSDLHFPYQDERAIAAAINHIDKHGFDTLLFNGDLIDFYQVSNFNKDPSRKNVWYEIQMVMEFLDMIKDAFPDKRLYWKLGNHEERFFTFMKAKAPELWNMPILSFDEIFQLNEFGVKLIDGKQLIRAGKLNILHGHEFGRSFFNPVNPARGLFLKAKASTLAGHNHQTSSHHENDLNNNPLATWSTGCLCELTPDYRPFGYLKWNHGAARVTVERSGSFHVDNFRIIEGKIR